MLVRAFVFSWKTRCPASKNRYACVKRVWMLCRFYIGVFNEAMRPYLLTGSNKFGMEIAGMFFLLRYDCAVHAMDTIIEKLLRIKRAMEEQRP